jgi:hypothetical protein
VQGTIHEVLFRPVGFSPIAQRNALSFSRLLFDTKYGASGKAYQYADRRISVKSSIEDTASPTHGSEHPTTPPTSTGRGIRPPSARHALVSLPGYFAEALESVETTTLNAAPFGIEAPSRL